MTHFFLKLFFTYAGWCVFVFLKHKFFEFMGLSPEGKS